MVAKYRKKPVVIEAIQLTPESMAEVLAFVGKRWARGSWGPVELEIETLEGVHYAREGDWIIKGVAKEFYPCKPDIFAKTYEPCE